MCIRDRTYGIQLNAANQAVVNVPWTDTDTTYTSSDFTHNSLTGVAANEHIDWTIDQGATNIHTNNYTNTTYGIATDTTAGLIELWSNTDQTVAANAVSTTAGRTYGIQLNAANQAVVNVPWTDTTYTSSDFTHNSLTGVAANEHIDWTVDQGTTNIHTGNYTNTTYGVATASVSGLVQIGYVENGKNYPVELSSNKMFVNVPWTDTDTTYTSSDFTHDNLTGVAANEHIDWTVDQGATNIHANNYTHSHAYVTSLTGTANEVEVSASTGSVTVGLPNDVTITGTLSAASKSFLIPHPNKEGKKLRHGSLEGPENGVYIRGRLFGTDKIELPDFWKGLVDFDTITVQLTAKHNSANVKVGNITEESIEVVQSLWSKLFGNRIDCFYTVYAERNDIAKLIVEE